MLHAAFLTVQLVIFLEILAGRRANFFGRYHIASYTALSEQQAESDEVL